MNAVERFWNKKEIFANNTFVLDASSGVEYNYADFAQKSFSAGSALASMGVQKGDRVALVLSNCIELACLYFACWFHGFTAVPVNPLLPLNTQKDILELSKVRVLISEETGCTAETKAPRNCIHLSVGTEGSDAASHWDPLQCIDAINNTPALPSPKSVLSISFTSGTTAEPKGVAHHYESIICNAEYFAEMNKLGANNRFYNVLPMTFMAGFYNLLLLPWLCGASVVIDKNFGPREALKFWAVAEKHHVDTLWLVPTIMSILVKMNRNVASSVWSSHQIKRCFVGTAPLSMTLRHKFEEMFGVQVIENYGLSESLFLTTNTSEDNSPGKVGKPLPKTRIWTVDKQGDAIPSGAEGEIVVDSQMMMAGYLEEQGLALPPSPFPTGDFGYIDDKGILAITGRKKDIILKGGENISPARIEEVVMKCPGVNECAVVGVPHDDYGEAVVAVLVLSRPYEQVLPELKALCSRTVGQHSPNYYYEIDSLPKTSNGKIDKKSIRALLAGKIIESKIKLVKKDTVESSQERVVDLTLDLFEGMQTFPSGNHPKFSLEKHVNISDVGRQVSKMVLGTHTGTHIDAPSHFIHEGVNITQIPLSTFIGPAYMVCLLDIPDRASVGLDLLRDRIATSGAKRLILNFGWSSRLGCDHYFMDHPYLTLEAAKWIVDSGVKLLGMDTPQPDDPRSVEKKNPDSPVHKLLLGSGVVLLEYLCNLDQLKKNKFEIAALPLKLCGADGSPVRCVAVEKCN